ncbi:MAG: HAMP domain-containing sensor histidine kinase, partial [Patescibacteria group bacterium]
NERMMRLLDAMLNISRLELGTFIIEPKNANVAKISSEIANELKPQIFQKKIKFKEKYGQHLEKIRVDPKILQIILQNILSNAVKYTPDRGKISLSVRLSNNSLLIKVSDNGYGIPLKQHHLVFGKFFRADNIYKVSADGTGLGLYIVKYIVDYYKGSIKFKSKEDKGSVFHVTLPLNISRKKGTKSLI